MEINISVELVLVSAKPPLRALADVTLCWPEGQITIRRFAVFENPGQPPWASVPRLKIERNGRRVYLPLLELPKDLKRRILEAVLQEYQRVSHEQ